MSNPKPFSDTSIFQNIREWTDNDGTRYRAEWSGGLWKTFTLDGNIARFCVTVQGSRGATARQIHDKIMATPIHGA